VREAEGCSSWQRWASPSAASRPGADQAATGALRGAEACAFLDAAGGRRLTTSRAGARGAADRYLCTTDVRASSARGGSIGRWCQGCERPDRSRRQPRASDGAPSWHAPAHPGPARRGLREQAADRRPRHRSDRTRGVLGNTDMFVIAPATPNGWSRRPRRHYQALMTGTASCRAGSRASPWRTGCHGLPRRGGPRLQAETRDYYGSSSSGARSSRAYVA